MKDPVSSSSLHPLRPGDGCGSSVDPRHHLPWTNPAACHRKYHSAMLQHSSGKIVILLIYDQIIDPHFGGNFFASLQSSIIYLFWCNLLAFHNNGSILFFFGSISSFCLCSALVCHLLPTSRSHDPHNIHSDIIRRQAG